MAVRRAEPSLRLAATASAMARLNCLVACGGTTMTSVVGKGGEAVEGGEEGGLVERCAGHPANNHRR